MKLKVFYVYFKFFIWIFLITTIIDAFCISEITRDPIALTILTLQYVFFVCVFLEQYQLLQLPDDCKTWKEYYDSLIELKKQPLTKEDKKILKLFMPPD